MKKIGKRSFYALVEGPEEFEIPEGVEEIGESAFEGNIIRKIHIPATVREIGNSAFFESRHATELVISEGSQLKVIPVSFISRSDSLRTVTLSEGITEILGNAFSECGRLEDVNFPSTLKSIIKDAFRGSGLTKISLPSGLDFIGFGSFSNMVNPVAEIRSDNPVPPYSYGAWNGISSDIPVYVPEGSGEAYRTDVGWRYFSNFIETEGVPSGLGDVAADAAGVKIHAGGGSIVIECIDNVAYSVFRADGRMVKSGIAGGAGERIALPTGLYLVKAGDVTAKIVL